MPPNMLATSAAGEATDAVANGNDEFKSSVDTNSARIALPYGKCILPDYIARDVADGTPRFVLLLYIVVTTLLLSFAPFLPTVMARVSKEDGAPFLTGYYTAWDQDHGIAWEWTRPVPLARQLNGVIVGLLEEAMGLSPTETLNLALWGTLFPFGLLFVADALSSSRVLPRSFRLDWPRSWETGNTQCYTDMFCEPTRVYRDGGSTACGLVRRPGNTYSNAVYLFGAECILLSAWRQYSHVNSPADLAGAPTGNLFLDADVLFGVMLLILSILSTIWHASNAPRSQYVDIWSMECCIVFLNIRIMLLGGFHLLRSMDQGILGRMDAEQVTSVCSFVIYAIVVASFGRLHYNKYQQRFLHGGCPFSGRVRLYSRGKVGNLDLDTLGVCLFAGLPIIYLIAPTAVQIFVLRSGGSLAASTIAVTSLIIGWSLRMFERFCLDGWPPVNWVRERQRRRRTKHGKSTSSNGRWLAKDDLEQSFLTTIAAVTSPTAILHFFTGITLVAGYVHVRTLEQWGR